MFPGRTLITGMLVVAVIAGCTKKKDNKDQEFTSSKSTTTAPAASQDIFDEFYKEDSTSAPAAGSPAETEPVRSMAPAPEFTENGRFCVQVSTVVSRRLADAVRAQLEAKGYPTYIAEVNNPTPSLPGTYQRIRIGGFTSISAARAFGENSLIPDGYDYWVDNRSNDNVGLEGYGMGEGAGGYSTPASDYSTTTTDYSTTTSDYSTTSSDYSTTTTDYSQPATEYQPEPATSETQPSTSSGASQYTPETATEEFGTTTPAETQKPQTTPPAGSSTQNEWGNDEW
jgi:hypothetical protein